MNPQNHDDLTADLERVLRDRAAGIAGAPLGLADVKGRASRIRRRQALAAGAGVAAVLAVAVPLGLSAGGVLGGASPDPAPATNTATDDAAPTPTETAVRPAPSGPRPMDFSDLEQGAPPQAVWSDRGEVRLGADTVADLRRYWPYDSVTRIAGDQLVVATRDADATQTATLVDGDGQELGSWPLQGAVAVSADDKLAAFAGPDGSVTVLQPDGSALDLPAAPAPGPHSVVGIRGTDCNVGCEVYVVSQGQEPKTWVSTPERLKGIGDLLSVTAVAETLEAGITDYNEDLSTCSALVRPDGSPVAETCDHRVFGFSADGRFALGYSSYGDGLGHPELALLDATSAEPIVSLRSTEEHQGFVSTAVWEDDAHVLAVVHSDGQWGVIRFGVDGSLEWAVAPRAGEDVDVPFHLSGGR